MSKTGKILSIASIAILLALGAIYIIQRRRVALRTFIDSPVQTGTKSLFPLQYGSRGDEVRKLQAWLNENKPSSFSDIVVDGVWGPKTDALVKQVLRVSTLDKNMFNTKIA